MKSEIDVFLEDNSKTEKGNESYNFLSEKKDSVLVLEILQSAVIYILPLAVLLGFVGSIIAFACSRNLSLNANPSFSSNYLSVTISSVVIFLCFSILYYLLKLLYYGSLKKIYGERNIQNNDNEENIDDKISETLIISQIISFFAIFLLCIHCYSYLLAFGLPYILLMFGELYMENLRACETASSNSQDNSNTYRNIAALISILQILLCIFQFDTLLCREMIFIIVFQLLTFILKMLSLDFVKSNKENNQTHLHRKSIILATYTINFALVTFLTGSYLNMNAFNKGVYDVLNLLGINSMIMALGNTFKKKFQVK